MPNDLDISTKWIMLSAVVLALILLDIVFWWFPVVAVSMWVGYQIGKANWLDQS